MHMVVQAVTAGRNKSMHCASIVEVMSKRMF
jgi:hypothetical protein